MTPEQQTTIETLYQSPQSHTTLERCMSGNWQDAVRSLYDAGYIAVWYPDQPSKTKYELTSKGRDYYIEALSIEPELPFTD